MSFPVPVGELVFALVLGLVLGSRLGPGPGEGRVRVGYAFALLAAVFLYGSYDFYTYTVGGVVLQRTWYWPGLSGAFLFSTLGILLGRELSKARVTSKGGTS